MPVQSAYRRLANGFRRLAGRTPLRVKLVAALLALVAVALVVISAVSVALFRNSQVRHASQQLSNVFSTVQNDLHNPRSAGMFIPGRVLPAGSYLIIVRPPDGQLNVPPSVNSLPDVPSRASWLSAHAGQVVTVPGTSGSENWLVITQKLLVTVRDPFSGDVTSRHQDTLIVGVDLGDINGAVNRLIGIDVYVSLVILAALAIAGIAAVRASLRPLTDIERTARTIAAGDLSRRVPDRDPRTEVGRLGRSLNTMLSQIEAAFHAQSQSEAAARQSEDRMRRFIADASHELRTPLTAIRGYAEYYRQRGGLANGGPAANGEQPVRDGQPGAAASGAQPEGAAASGGQPGTPAGSAPGSEVLAGGPGAISGADMNRIMERVEQESARMGVLVEDLLLLARLDQQRPLDLRPVDLLTVAADAVQDARMMAPERTVDLNVGAGAAFLVLGDEVRLRQVIGNLLSNALTHTPEGTPVHVRLSTGAGPGTVPSPAVLLEVADEGPGMAPEQAERVFERFYRADAARTRMRGAGSGLGLAIVAALVAAHGGSVSVDTAPGRGATFQVTLPLAPDTQDS